MHILIVPIFTFNNINQLWSLWTAGSGVGGCSWSTSPTFALRPVAFYFLCDVMCSVLQMFLFVQLRCISYTVRTNFVLCVSTFYGNSCSSAPHRCFRQL